MITKTLEPFFRSNLLSVVINVLTLCGASSKTSTRLTSPPILIWLRVLSRAFLSLDNEPGGSDLVD